MTTNRDVADNGRRVAATLQHAGCRSDAENIKQVGLPSGAKPIKNSPKPYRKE